MLLINKGNQSFDTSRFWDKRKIKQNYFLDFTYVFWTKMFLSQWEKKFIHTPRFLCVRTKILFSQINKMFYWYWKRWACIELHFVLRNLPDVILFDSKHDSWFKNTSRNTRISVENASIYRYIYLNGFIFLVLELIEIRVKQKPKILLVC